MPGAQTRLLTKGSFLSPAEPVDTGTPDALHAFPVDAPHDRLGLAKWLVASDNPLTARVLVKTASGHACSAEASSSPRRTSARKAPCPSHPGAARSPGRRLHGGWLELQAALPAHRHVTDLPPVLDRHAGAARARSNNVLPLARPALPPQRRDGGATRPLALSGSAQRHDVRSQRLPAPARRRVAGRLQRRSMAGEQRR